MKKLITMAVAILITAFITVFASGKPAAAIPQKHYTYQLKFSKIEVSDDIDLQLIEGDNNIIEITGNDADVENVDWKIKGDVLYMTSNYGSLRDKVHVTIYVNKLKEIVIKGQSSISTDGTLLSPALYVYVESGCNLAIKNKGQIYIVNNDNTEVDVKWLVGDVRVGK